VTTPSTPDPLRYAVVVPTLGRPSLVRLLESLAAQEGPLPEQVVVVDDRREPVPPLEVPAQVAGRLGVTVVPGFGRGPAAARNVGWRLTRTPWVAFLDDDVVVTDDWAVDLTADLSVADGTGGSQGCLVVPLPTDRPPTDWERGTAGLEQAEWATADMAYRRAALVAVHGFDERFPRAYREDADLALRVCRAGWSLQRGRRRTIHPVRPADDGVSLRVQRGNADDALMRRLHGRHWRTAAATGHGRLPWHVLTVAVAGLGAGALAAGAGRRGRSTPVALAGLGAWAGLTARFAALRIAPGPRDRSEVWRMTWTSAAIPFAAVWHRARGWWRHRDAAPWPPPAQAVLFDRDGTLVHDVPYNADPGAVSPVPQAARSVARLRSAGLRVGVVSNQSGVARGLITPEALSAVNAAVEDRVGRIDTWQVCVHGPEDACSCRKPRPGLVQAAARELGVRPQHCVVIGDIGADVLAARAAGARGILVPTDATLPHEVATAPEVAVDLETAVDLVLGRRHVG